MWIKMERLWYVKKSEVSKDNDNNNKYCTTVNVKDAIDKSTTHNDTNLISLHVCKWNRPMT